MKKIIFIISLIYVGQLNAECSDLDSLECVYWGEYCEWNEDTDQCQEIGGGGDVVYGPYDVFSISQSDGMRDGPLYLDATLYYPDSAETPLTSVILGPGWGGDGASMSDWAYFFASYGFIATTIDYNDPINESHQQRAEAMLDLVITVKLENSRADSPVLGLIDTNKFALAGYSISGGVTQIAATMDSTLDAVIALNPTIIIEDCEGCSDFEYCICLLPDHLDHTVPTLIIAGENEIDELPDYDGLLGGDQYDNTPETTIKMLYEIQDGGHSSAVLPFGGFIQGKTLEWLKYHLLGDADVCNSLLEVPDDASQFLTTLECVISLDFDINGDGSVDSFDLVTLVSLVINGNTMDDNSDLNDDDISNIFDILILSDYLNG